jgi:hypothetical protein
VTAKAVKRAAAAALAATLILPAGALGSVTIGSNLGRAPNVSASTGYSFTLNELPPSYQAADGVTSPVNGTVVAWRVRSGASGGDTGFQVVKPLGGNLFTATGSTEILDVPPNATSSFTPPGLPISIGDRIGIWNDGSYGGLIFTKMDFAAKISYWNPYLQTGAPGREPNDDQSFEIMFNAEITPTNTFTAGVTARNKKKGTATITVESPNAGEVVATGNGVKTSGLARSSKAVSAPGPVTFLIKAKGKKKVKLNQTGKVKVTLNVTFTPTGGSANTVPTKVKLKKKL